MSIAAPIFAGAGVGSTLATDEPWQDEADESSRRPASTPARQRADEHEAGSAREQHLADLSGAAKRGLPHPGGHLDREEQAAWDYGAAEAHRERRAARRQKSAALAANARAVTRGAVPHLRRAGAAVSGGAASVATARPLSGWGIVAGVLGLVLLYLFLTRTSLADKAISGLISGLNWFIAPKPLPI
jgi:hypothetical protein